MSATTYAVKFFDARASRSAMGGMGGIRTAYFSDRVEAEQFASTQRLYSQPATVRELAPLTTEQLKAVSR